MMTPMDPEIATIQTEWLERNRLTTRWIIVAEPEGFSVHQHDCDGVAPSHVYQTKAAAAARLLQLLGLTEPVLPQSWPETVLVTLAGTQV